MPAPAVQTVEKSRKDLKSHLVPPGILVVVAFWALIICGLLAEGKVKVSPGVWAVFGTMTAIGSFWYACVRIRVLQLHG